MIPEELEEVIESGLLTSSEFDGGKYVQELERMFRDYTGANFAIAVNSGTSALYASILVMDQQNTNIAFPSFTFRATKNAILASGAHAIPIDVSLDNMTIIPRMKTIDCIIPVHLYGHVAHIDELLELDRPIIEDCAQALGSKWKNKSVGRFGNVGCFSFYPSKIISGAEGGMIITDNGDIADALKVFRNHGNEKNWGLNLRLSEVHASIAVSNMRNIETLLTSRKITAKGWETHFNTNTDSPNPDIILPVERKGETRNNQLFTIRAKNREVLINTYKKSRVYYPYTLGDGINAKKLSETVLSFPT